ncbi:MAG: hypothetical protein H6649_07215 [Caldilineae bacterium]|nr:hypothetical protein [Anaerolineae bacterium]MCB0205723.1 hypothetical protein [Anaerolineae bacterium]MCB9153829.1 hypothetical protein [Caldilineae bacterium]
MYGVNEYMEDQLRTRRMADCMRRAELDRICREAGIDRRGWTNRQVCRVMCIFGHWLVAMGRRLEATDLSAMARTSGLRHGI